MGQSDLAIYSDKKKYDLATVLNTHIKQLGYAEDGDDHVAFFFR